MYKRILVATSQLPGKDAAVEYAITLAADTGAELSILTVLTPYMVAGMPDLSACAAIALESMAAQSRSGLHLAARAATEAGVSYSTQVRWGNVPGTILASAAADHCDLIILNTEHSTWRRRRRHDYIARQVSTRAQQPVLLVSQAPPLQQYGAPLWASLLVIRDSSWQGEAAEAYAYALAQTAFLEVSVLQLDTVPEHLEAAYLSAAAMLDQPCHWPIPVEAAEMVYSGLAATSRAASTFVETMERTACDVILLGMRQDTGWKRWFRPQPTGMVLAATERPVLLVNQWLID